MRSEGDCDIGVALSIAGTDPSGGAGIYADLQVFRDLGFYGTAAITAVVWQNTQGVKGWHAMEAGQLRAQLEALDEDFRFDAVKIGMVPGVELLEEVGRFLDGLDEEVTVVLDPVMASGSGEFSLMDGAGRRRLGRLAGRVDLITPNGPEAFELVGASDRDTPVELVEAMLGQGWKRVLLKGGHLRRQGAPSVVDWYGDEHGVVELKQMPSIKDDVRGTGCQLGSAIAVCRGRGNSWMEAVEEARSYLNDLLQNKARMLGRGRPLVVRLGEQQ